MQLEHSLMREFQSEAANCRFLWTDFEFKVVARKNLRIKL